MHLNKVILNNFRCFDHIEVDLHPQLTVFVAENGGGKTALLDGIAVGLSPILKYLSSANQRLRGPGIEDKDFRLESWEGRGGHDVWGASDYSQIIIQTTSGLKWDNWRPSAAGKQPQESVGQNNLSNQMIEVLESLKTPAPKSLPVFAYYGARRGWIPIPERIRETKVDYSHPTAALFGALDSLSDFKEMLKWFDTAEANELRANKDYPSDDYLEYPPLLAVREAISTLLGNTYSSPRFNSKHKFVITEEKTTRELQISQLSQGYQAMLAMGMDFARRLALANPHYETFTDDKTLSLGSAPHYAPSIMLVDEIDLHLHPSWQQRVLGDLTRAFPGTQFIVTTHSPQVLTTVKRENIRLLKQDLDGAWTAPMPDEETKGTESASALVNVMNVDPVPPVQEAEDLSRYKQLIQLGQDQSEEGQRLRSTLESHFGIHHPLILDCDRLIRLERFKATLPPPNHNPA